MTPFNSAVEDFRDLYDRVTRAMLQYRDQQLTGRPAEGLWLTDLIDGFEKRYLQWDPPPKKHQGEKVIVALRAKGVGRTARLCGFAYLHICLDLPVVISHSLPRMGRGPTYDLSNPDAGALYLALGPVLERVYERHLASGRWLSTFGILRGAAWLDRRAVKVLGYWVIMLRTASWLHADAHRGKNSTLLQLDYEERLADRLSEAIEEALKLRWWQVISALSVPTLGLGAIILCGLSALALPISANAAFPFFDLGRESLPILVLVALGMTRLFASVLQATYVNEFGKTIFRRMVIEKIEERRDSAL